MFIHKKGVPTVKKTHLTGEPMKAAVTVAAKPVEVKLPTVRKPRKNNSSVEVKIEENND